MNLLVQYFTKIVDNDDMRFIRVLLNILFIGLICGCSSNSTSASDTANQSSFEDEQIIVSTSYHSPISEDILNEITNAFYQQSFVEKGVTDDSSFCGHYEPRLINLNSFMPLYNYGIYPSYYVLTFAINGFYGLQTSFHAVEINDGKLSFPFLELYSYGMMASNYLIPQVYKNGKIYNIIDAYNNKVIGDEIFSFYTNNKGVQSITLQEKGVQLKQLTKEYYDSLPPLKKDQVTTYSYLTPEFEEVKWLFYQLEIVAKGYKDDSHFREHFVEEKYKTPKPINEYSVHLNEYYDVSDSVRVYTVSVNDIYVEKQSYFGDITGRSFPIGGKTYTTAYQIEPIIVISGRLYFITEAYKQGLFTNELTEALNEAFPYGDISYRKPYSHQLEYKYVEREFLYK